MIILLYFLTNKINTNYKAILDFKRNKIKKSL